MLDPYPSPQSASTYEQAFNDLRNAFQNLCVAVDQLGNQIESLQSVKRTTNDFEGSALHIQANTMESSKFSIEVPMPTTSVALALVQQEPTKEHEQEKVLQESDSLDGAHANFEFDDCFYDQPSMVHDRRELIEVRRLIL